MHSWLLEELTINTTGLSLSKQIGDQKQWLIYANTGTGIQGPQ